MESGSGQARVMSNSSVNKDSWLDSFGDDSFKTCDDEQRPETHPTKSVSWARRDDATQDTSTEETLRTGSMLQLDSTGGSTSDILTDAEAERIFPDEKDGDCNDSPNEKDTEQQPMLGEDKDLNELEGDNDLPFDSFSMLYVAKSFQECCLPVAVFGLQMLILILTMINLLQTSDRPLATMMNVPVDVPLTVKISQYIACMVSVFTADDLISGALHVGRRVVKKVHMNRVRILPDSQRKSERISLLMRQISEANNLTRRHWKWELANSMRIMEGALVIVVSFIFIVQSSTAIDLWLNFAGVQFVGMLDDTAYHLSQNRFLGSMARHLADRVSDFEVYQEGEKHKKKIRRARLALFAGICIAMWAGLSVFVYNQAQLTYACNSITIIVGESRHQKARFFSGRYIIQRKKINGRAVYIQEQGNGAFLAFCAENDINRWTISPLDNNESPHDPCKKIRLQSQRTKTHDVSELGDSFQFWTGDSADANIYCNQCNPNRKGGDCSYQGNCNTETNLCECETGFFGSACEFRGPCTELVMHEEFHGFYSRGFQKSWDLLYLNGSPVMVYERPVYVQNIGGDIFDVIIFDGGRWFVSQSDYFRDWFNTFTGKETPEKSFAKYLTTSFNARGSDYISSYISAEPSNLASPSNIPFRAWLSEASEENLGKLGDEEYELLCADCHDGVNGISFCVGSWGETDYSLCKSTENEIHGTVNRCECLPGFSGPLCRLRPVEGTASLHLDHASGMCSTCYEDNPWTVWDIDGINVPCYSMGKLFFEDGNVTFSRQLGLHLNESHFSVFVSRADDTLDTLCLAKAGSEELYAIRRDEADERIYVNVAIHLDNKKESLGEVVKPEEVQCLASTEVDHDVCSTSLPQVYSTADMKSSMLRHAWLLLDLKITSSQSSIDPAAVDQNNASSAVLPTTGPNEEATPAESTPALAQNSTILSSNEATNIASAFSEQYTFAVIPKTATNVFFLPVKDGCEERAAALSRPSVRGSILVKCLFVGPNDWNKTEQIEMAKELIRNQSVDGIAMSIIDEELSAEVVDMAVSADIPFITFDSDAPSTRRAAYVGTDNIALGEELAMLLLTRFATAGSYALISGIGTNLAQREKGIRTVLKDRNWREVISSPLIANSAGIFGEMHDLMKNHSDLTAILCTLGGVMRMGEGKEWKSFVQEYPDLFLLSADSMPDQIDLLNRGYVNGLVGQQPADMGSKSIDTLLSLSKGHEVEDFIATSLVVLGRVNKGNPYNPLVLSSAARQNRISATRILLMMILAFLAFVAVLV